MKNQKKKEKNENRRRRKLFKYSVRSEKALHMWQVAVAKWQLAQASCRLQVAAESVAAFSARFQGFSLCIHWGNKEEELGQHLKGFACGWSGTQSGAEWRGKE